MASFLTNCVLTLLVCIIGVVFAQETPQSTPAPPLSTKEPPAAKTTTTSVSTTTPTVQEECAALNTTCSDCVGHPKCLWCYNPQKCVPFPVGQILPHKDICELDEARWGVCLVNFKILIIAMGVVGGIILLTIISCCVYCCCCRGNERAKKKYLADEAKWEQERDSRRRRNEDRRAERQTKLDDIRRKYGLMKDETPYQKFEES